jgi:hypothetical protein
MSFRPIGSVTRIVVSVRGSHMKEITNESEIRSIVSFLDSHRDGWATPWYGVPVGAVILEFWNTDEAKGSFGVGVNFFETQRQGEIKSIKASHENVRDFLELLNLGEDVLKWR